MTTNPLRLVFIITALTTTCTQAADTTSMRLVKAAEKSHPEARWREATVIVGDFTCSGREQWAILGTSDSDILIAVFVKSIRKAPEILRYPKSARDELTAVLSVEDMNFDPKRELGYELPGFTRSTSCKGLNLSDGKVDSAHIYWNRGAKRFDDWTR